METKAITELIELAKDTGYTVILESDTELMFLKRNPPLLTNHGYYAGALLGSVMAIKIVEHGLRHDLKIRFAETVAEPGPDAKEGL